MRLFRFLALEYIHAHRYDIPTTTTMMNIGISVRFIDFKCYA